MNSKIMQSEITVGVDTGKTQLDIHIHPINIFFQVPNTKEGIKEALKTLKPYKPTRIVIEATGRLEHEFIFECAKAELPFTVANPIHIKNFSRTIGQLAKTDKLDAALIANYGATIKPSLSQLKPENMRFMSDLLSRRRQLMGIQTMEKNRLGSMPKTISSLINPVLTVIKNQLAKVDEKLIKLIASCPEYKEKYDTIQSMPGIGNVVTFNLLSNMPELGTLTNKQASALVGVAPINKESGIYNGKRKIRGGRHQIRSAMFMAAMSAMQCNPVIKTFYERLVASGKPKKLAVVACIRKTIVILNAMVRDGVKWQEKIA